MSSILSGLVKNSKVKNVFHWLLIPTGEARPRKWVSWFVNPFFHTRKKGSKIRWRTRIDVLPFREFSLGHKSVIEDFTTINNGVGNVIIGDGTLIGMSNVIIGPVTIGNNIIIAQNVVVSGLNHDYQDITKPICKQPISTKLIVIEDGCWIAANVVITAGVTIGRNSIVAAGSVVTKSIGSYCVAAGNPAIVIKKYDFSSNDWIKV